MAETKSSFEMELGSESINRIDCGLSPENPLCCWIPKYKNVSEMDEVEFDMHYDLEMGVVLEGKMERHSEGSQSELGPGSIWFCGVWEPHGFKVLSKKCKHLVVIISPSLLMDRSFPGVSPVQLLSPFSAAPNLRPQIPSSHQKEVIALAKEIDLCDNSNSLGKANQINLLERLILLSIKFSPTSSIQYKSLYRSLLPALELGIKSCKPISNRAAAITCSMSEEKFSKSFRKQFGISFNKFSLRNRLNQTAEVLRETDKPIKIIVDDFGFTDESHLHRLFIKHYQISPGKYRQKNML